MANKARKDGFEAINAAGLNKKNSKAFDRKNPEAVELYGKTYQNIEDKELKEKFKSRNKNEAAAMLVATDKMADEGLFIDASNPKKNKRNTNLLKSYYEQSLAEIESGEVIGSYNADKFTAVDKQKAKEKKKADEEKEAKAKAKVKSHSVEVECGDPKTCTLTKFRIDTAPKKEAEDSVPKSLLFKKAKSDVLKMIDAELEAEDVSNIVDIFNSDKNLEVIHLIGGKQKYFQRNIKVVSKGTCDHGNSDTTCPQVHIKSTNASIDDTKSNDLWLNNTDNQLVNTRVFPHDSSVVAPEYSIKGFIKLLTDSSGKHQSTYDFETKSCQEHVYNNYFGQLVIHRPNIIKYGFKIVTPIFGDGSKDKKTKVTAEFYSRMDEDEFTHNLSVNNLKSAITEIIPGPAWLADMIMLLQHTLNRMSALGTEDGESSVLEVSDEDLPEEYPPISEQKIPDDPDASIQPIEVHLAYRRILKHLPDYSNVAYKHEVYLAFSPLIQYKKTVNAINAIWKTSLRATAATASAGLSEAAVYLADKTGITERASGAFYAFYTVLRNIAKSYKLDESEINMKAPSHIEITDKEVSAYLGTNNVGVGAKVKCLLEMSMAVETDNPGNGFVIVKEPDESITFDRGSSGFYAGVNASITGEVQANLRLLKILGISLGREAATGAKIEVISEDNTAPVRLGINFNFNKEFVANAEALAKNKQKIAEAAEKVRLEATLKLDTIDKSNKDDYNEAKNIVKEAGEFSKKAQKAADKARSDIEHAREQEDKAQNDPLGMQTSLLFSGIAVYFSAYIELTKYQLENKGQDDKIFSDDDDDTSDEVELEEASKTTMQKKFSLGLFKQREILPAWTPLPFKHIMKQSYSS